VSGAARVALVLFGRPGGAFNAAGEAGLARAAARHGIVPRVLWQADAARRAATLRAAAAEADLVIAHGGQGEQAAVLVAPEFPGTAFAVTQGRVAGPNLAGFEVLQEHSAFLAGALAGWWCPGGVVAHLSGEPVPPGLRGRAGFAAGLRHADPAVRLLTGFCGDQHDPELARRWTEDQARQGARLQFTMLDAGRPGAVAACKALGLRAIGNVRDWTREDPVFLASAIADSGRALEVAVAAFLGGHFAERRIGLEEPEAVRLALAPEVGAALRAWLEGLATAIREGAIEVPETWTPP
jgi:basic membrane protein A